MFNIRIYYKKEPIGTAKLEDEGIYGSGYIELSEKGKQVIAPLILTEANNETIDVEYLPDKETLLDENWIIYFEDNRVMHSMPEFYEDNEIHIMFGMTKQVENLDDYLNRYG